jgi:SAM-dependent methyltransferase
MCDEYVGSLAHKVPLCHQMTQGSQRSPKHSKSSTSWLFSRIAAALGWRARAFFEKAHNAKTTLEIAVRQALGFRESETRLIGDSQSYWNDLSDGSLKQNSHWRGVGIFSDDTRWLALGRGHLDLYEEFRRVVNLKHPLKRVVEWGCGGCMNAVHFARLADEFYGVDISSASLDECGNQMKAEGLHNFKPVLIDASDPEAALGLVRGPCDLLISTYVFELLPTPEYGLRVLRIVHELLAPGGIAVIQVKYSEGDWKTRSQGWAYVKNLAWNATYRIEEFWQAAERCGFTPKMVTLLPKQPLVNDRNYAYFLLQKSAGHNSTPT